MFQVTILVSAILMRCGAPTNAGTICNKRRYSVVIAGDAMMSPNWALIIALLNVVMRGVAVWLCHIHRARGMRIGCKYWEEDSTIRDPFHTISDLLILRRSSLN